MNSALTVAPACLLAALLTVSVYADDAPIYSLDDSSLHDVSFGADQKDAGQKGDGKDSAQKGDGKGSAPKGDGKGSAQKGDCSGCGGKGGGCSCFLFGSSEPLALYSGDNGLGISIGGWTQFGYHSQDSVNDGFNQQEDKVNLHQQWFWMERVADGSVGLDFGFRVDAMYGIDADNTQAFGNDPGEWDYLNGFDHGIYGWALPQVYGEVAMGDLSVKVGHFFTVVGYEVVTAPDNFFYSHAFTMNNSEPFTHTGVLATYNMTDNLTTYSGWTLGWDTGFDQQGNGSSWLGGFGYALTEDISLTYINTYGDFGWLGGGADDSYSHSVVVDVALTERMNYVFQSDMVDAGVFDTVGINQYLFYNLNDCLSVGSRMEWWKANGVSYNSYTSGLNYRPHANLVLRPEVKREWAMAGAVDQTIFGMDAILTY